MSARRSDEAEAASGKAATSFFGVSPAEADRLREAVLRTLVDKTRAAIAIMDGELRFLFVNDALTRMNGVPRAAHLGRTMREVLPSMPRDLDAKILRVFETGEPLVDLEVSGGPESLRGEVWHCLTSYYRIEGLDGAPLAVAALITEITAQRESEGRLDLLLEASEILGTSLDYETTRRSLAQLLVPRFADICFVDLLDEGGAQRAVEIAHVDPEKLSIARTLRRRYPQRVDAQSGLYDGLLTGQRELYREITDELLVTSSRDADHLELMRALGMRSVMVVPLSAERRTFGTLTVVSTKAWRIYTPLDLSMMKKLASRAALAIDNARLYAEERRAREAREEMIAVVSHDLKSPLSVLSLSADMIARNAPPGPAGEANRKRAAMMARATARMDRLIHDLLDAASIEAGCFSITRAEHDAIALVSEAAELIAPLAEPKAILVVRRVPGERCRVLCDRDRALQVLSNLLGNAIKFTPHGGRIELSARGGEDEVVFSVADTGPGIEPEEQRRIFDRFWTGRGKAGADSGLGLYIAKGIVEAHGCRIWVETEVGLGSAFWFTLPAAPQGSAA